MCIRDSYNLDYGISFRIKSLLLSTSFKLQNWSNIRLNSDSNSEEYFIEENLTLSNDYKSTLQLNLGLSYSTKFNNFNTSFILGHSHIPSYYKFDNSKDQNIISGGFSLNFKDELIINFSTNHTHSKLFTSDRYTPSGIEESIEKTIYSINLIIGI